MSELDQVIRLCEDTNKAAKEAASEAREAAKGVVGLKAQIEALDNWMESHAVKQDETEKELRAKLELLNKELQDKIYDKDREIRELLRLQGLDVDRLQGAVKLMTWIGTTIGGPALAGVGYAVFKLLTIAHDTQVIP